MNRFIRLLEGILYEIIIGGAALNGEIESFLRHIDFHTQWRLWCYRMWPYYLLS